MNNNETNTTEQSPAFAYAKAFKNSNRVCQRYESCFVDSTYNQATEKWSNLAGKLLFLAQDISLNREGMTRSKIVMAYGKQNNAWNGIVMYIQMNTERAYNIIDSTSFDGLSTADARLLIVSKFASFNT